MYWQEDKTETTPTVPDDIVDVVFGIACRALPVDHAYELSRAVTQVLPWFADEEGAGLHTVHVAESGNGWMRPENPDDLLYLSRRTRLTLRLPRHRVSDAGALSGRTLDVAGNAMRVDKPSVRLLSTHTTVFARYIVSDDLSDESRFLATAHAQLGAIGIRPKKMLCGMEKAIRTPARTIRTRSVMIADLTAGESVTLQRKGLGPLRQLGCGVFIPHKEIREVGQPAG